MLSPEVDELMGCTLCQNPTDSGASLRGAGGRFAGFSTRFCGFSTLDGFAAPSGCMRPPLLFQSWGPAPPALVGRRRRPGVDRGLEGPGDCWSVSLGWWDWACAPSAPAGLEVSTVWYILLDTRGLPPGCGVGSPCCSGCVQGSRLRPLRTPSDSRPALTHEAQVSRPCSSSQLHARWGFLLPLPPAPVGIAGSSSLFSSAGES